MRPGRDARHMLLSDFRFYVKERFTYEYNIADQQSRPWQFESRFEQKVAREAHQHSPRCLGGVGASPPERCGGPVAFESLRALFTPEDMAWRTAQM